MTDLVEWLTGVWDEDEALAEAVGRAEGPDWSAGDQHLSDSVSSETRGYVASGPWGYMSWETRKLIARHDPTQVLARIAADRKILELHAPTPTTLVEVDGREVEQDSFEEIVGREVNCMACAGYPAAPCQTLLLLASTYADRPGYRSEWAV